jgi:copper chaperone CopZ
MPAKTVHVPDIRCEHCAATIQNGLRELAGVSNVLVDIQAKEVMLSWDEPPASWATIRARLVELEFPPDAE